MNNSVFYVIFYGEIVECEVGCVIQGRQQVGLRFNKIVKLEETKRKIYAKIAIRCGRTMSKLFYKFPISTDPLKFCIDANIEEWSNNGEDSYHSVKDYSDPNLDEVPEDIDDEGPEEVENVHAPSFSNPSRGIILRNDPTGDMLSVDLDAAYAPEFPEYADIVSAHRLTSNSQLKELFVGNGLRTRQTVCLPSNNMT
ncbi:hypothetical protein GOBAR_DD36100 [Gossypium barbadense]|nr:hypothetical protein GOBAR_DD36100 [Gossypium barbadense]